MHDNDDVEISGRSVAHYRQLDGESQGIGAHLEEAAQFASSSAGKIGLPTLGTLAGLLHDIGKYTTAFQEYIDPTNTNAEQMRGKIDHSSAGAQLFWNEVRLKDSPFVPLAGQMVALCVASHHSGLIDCLSPDGEDVFSTRMAKLVDPTSMSLEEEDIRARVADLLASSLTEQELQHVLSTLRGSGVSLQAKQFALGLIVRFLFSALIDGDRLSTADFENPAAAASRYYGAYPEWPILAQRLDDHIAGFSADTPVGKIRGDVSRACLQFGTRDKGLYQLTVPTGGGKTLASLRFALAHARLHDMDRIIYVAPYTSIIDQNASVVRSILEHGSGRQIVLEHHSNLTADKDTWRNRLLSENWDAPVVFTTAVQFLETLFGGGTRGARRMHQLANAVVILDEAQALPVKAVHLFNNAVNFLAEQCGATIVFCTATQPLLDRVDAAKGAARLSPNPEMIPDVHSLFRDLRRVEIIDHRKPDGWTELQLSELAFQQMEDTGSVLVIVNTKAHAKALYRQCREKTSHTYHLSTSMCPAHRLHHLNEIRDRLSPDNSLPVICVSTQLIEAGVDVDFGSVIRSLAGLDSIAQAAGRCNRNGLRATGKVFIVNPTGENLSTLPDIRIAQEVCARILDEFRADPAAFDNDLQGPTAMERYYHYYFFQRAHEMAYPVSPSDLGRNDTLLSLLSTNSQAVEAYKRIHKAAPMLSLRQSFRTAAQAFEAIDSPTQGVIVPYGEGAQLIEQLRSTEGLGWSSELLRQAQRYSVNMFPHEIKNLQEKHGLLEVWEGTGVLCLDDRYYSDEFGASVEQVGEMKTLFG